MDPRMDLNADVGEECADDDALFEVLTAANVAAGGHAGGGAVLERTVRSAIARGVVVGAHPSYIDRPSFGRVSRWDDHDETTVVAMIVEQSMTVAEASHRHGGRLAHVKAHGALYNDAAVRDPVARAVARAVRQLAGALGDDDLPAIGLPGSALERMCAEEGVRFVAEAYADRAYAPDGTLVPRVQAGSVLSDPEQVCRQVLNIALRQRIRAIDGTEVDVPARTICLHGDTPGAVDLARRVRAALEAAGVTVAPIGRP